MKNENCKMQIAESGIFNFQFAIFNLQFCIAVWLGAITFVPPTVAAEPKLLPQKLLEQGWISLFDGETLFGWQPVGDATWNVVDGEIRTDGSKPGFLMTTTEWADFVLILEFKAPASTNSGIFLRTGLHPTDPAKDCYEVNIAPSQNPFPTGSIVGRKKVEVIEGGTSLSDGRQGLSIGARGEWIVVTVAGGPRLKYSDPKPIRRGHIALQSNSGPVSFLSIRLRPLGLRPLFNGKDLTGWSTDRAEKSTFEVTKNGELHLTNGPGQIDSTGDFANFVLQAECKVNGDGLNSGIFFRTLREGRWAGYESQINNVFKDGDRTKPADFGTGGIYRRQPARRVVADDHQWFTNTIVADGPHMAVWVNGYQVSDWTDTRPAKENAREGRRDAGGAIAIQGHDATTNFLFRNIRAAELPRGEMPEVRGKGSE